MLESVIKPELTLYSVRETAKILGVSKDKVYELVYSDALPAMRLTTIKVSHKALANFISDSEGKDLRDPHNIHKLGFNS